MNRIDTKYIFEAINPVSKNTHSQNDGMIFLAKDKAFLEGALPGYLAKCIELGAGDEHIQSVKLLIERVTKYQAEIESKVPDTNKAGEITRCIHGEFDDMEKTGLTPDDINSVVVGEEYSFPSGTVTSCLLELANGAKVIGINYGSIDPASQNWEFGRKAAREAALEKVWELEGYLLRQKLYEKRNKKRPLSEVEVAVAGIATGRIKSSFKQRHPSIAGAFVHKTDKGNKLLHHFVDGYEEHLYATNTRMSSVLVDGNRIIQMVPFRPGVPIPLFFSSVPIKKKDIEIEKIAVKDIYLRFDTETMPDAIGRCALPNYPTKEMEGKYFWPEDVGAHGCVHRGHGCCTYVLGYRTTVLVNTSFASVSDVAPVTVDIALTVHHHEGTDPSVTLRVVKCEFVDEAKRNDFVEVVGYTLDIDLK